MSAADAVLRSAVADAIARAPRARILKIVDSLLDPDAMPGAIEAPQKLSTAAGRYLRVTADKVAGSHQEIPEDAWTLTHDQETGLAWTHVLGNTSDGQNHADSMRLASEFRFATAPAVAFAAPGIKALLSIIDYDSHDPAVDRNYFRGPYGWTWASTIYKGGPAGAWGVYLRGGYSGWDPRSNRGFCRAVCPSQLLGIR